MHGLPGGRRPKDSPAVQGTEAAHLEGRDAGKDFRVGHQDERQLPDVRSGDAVMDEKPATAAAPEWVTQMTNPERLPIRLPLLGTTQPITGPKLSGSAKGDAVR